MLRYFNADQKNSITKLEFILDSRKSRQQNKSNNVKRILSDVKKFGDKALIKYEKKFVFLELMPQNRIKNVKKFG